MVKLGDGLSSLLSTWLIVRSTSWPQGSSHTQSFVTGFWKTDRNVTLGLFHFIGPANAYTHTLHIRTAIIRLG